MAGATGLVGGMLLEGLLADASVAEVQVLGRRPVSRPHPKIRMHVVDFLALPSLPAVDEVYLALGTTLRAVGSREAFRAVDFDANFAVAKAALAAGARRIGLVSAMAANARSAIFYNRVKGELEDAILELPAEATVVARPGLLLGDRKRLGQPARHGEALATLIMKPLGAILPRTLRPVLAAKVARALLGTVPVTHGVRILSSAELQAY